MTSTQHDRKATAGVILRPPLVALTALVLGLVLQWIAPLGVLGQTAPALRYTAGAVLVLLAVMLFALAFRGFARAGTPVQTNRATTQLVTSGVYAHVRNPIYVAFTLLLTGIAVATGADWLIATTMLFAGAVHFGVVKREEAYLEAKFGDAYRNYRARVPRYGWKP
jgi:protein-S-isoprenylcysteine O-methyltransferase Ste14